MRVTIRVLFGPGFSLSYTDRTGLRVERGGKPFQANAEPIYGGLSGDRRFEKVAGPLYGHRNELTQIDFGK